MNVVLPAILIDAIQCAFILTVGPLRLGAESPGRFAGFESSNLGLGHIVLAVDDYDASLRFYRDGLGLRVSDYIDLDMGGSEATRVAFFHCGRR
jgi:hypothetical protein